MAGRTITQRIALVGGDEIKVQFNALAQTGELAFTRIAAAANSGGAFSKFGASLAAAQAKMADVATAGARVGTAITNVGDAVGRAAARVGVVAGVTLAGAAAKLVGIAKNAGNSQEALENSAEALGTNTASLDQFQKIAGLAGIGSESLNKALGRVNATANDQIKSDRTLSRTKADLLAQLQRGEITYTNYSAQIRKANEAADNSNDVFTRLGVSYRNADGTVKDSIQLFQELGQALGQIKDGTARSGLAMDAFGTKNAKVTRLSIMNAEEFRKQADEIRRLTPALQDAEREGLSNFGDRLELLGKVAVTTRDKLFAIFAPSFTRIVNAVIERVAGVRDAMLGIGADLEAKFKPIADDIVAAIEGRDADVKNAAILQFRDGVIQAGSDIKNAIGGIITAFEGLKAVFDVVATAINSVFGTKLTGGAILISAALLQLTGLFGVLTAAATALTAVIGALVTAFGAWPVVIIAASVALGLFVGNAIKQLGGVQAIATRILQGIPIVIGRVLAGIPIVIGQAVNGVVTLVSGVVSVIGSLISGIASFFAPAIAAVVAFAAAIIAAIGNVPTQIGNLFAALGAKIAGVWSSIVQTAAALWATVTQTFSAGVNGIINFFAALPTRIMEIWNSVVQFFAVTWDSIVQAAVTAGAGIADAMKSGVDSAIGYVKGLYDTVVSIFKSIMDQAAAVGSAIGNAFSGGGGGGESPQSNAQGGHIRGRGTGTSDSILSWLSNGEFVLQAKRVRQYGVGFLNALNQGTFKMPRFAEGGLASMASAILPSAPRFAGGGFVAASAVDGGGRPFTLQIGGESFPA